MASPYDRDTTIGMDMLFTHELASIRDRMAWHISIDAYTSDDVATLVKCNAEIAMRQYLQRRLQAGSEE